MGKVLVSAKIENLEDLYALWKGTLTQEQIRSVNVVDALVDSGATGLLLPKRLIQNLGLQQWKTQQARSVGGPVVLNIYSAVRLTIQGRDCICDVGEISDDLPAIIGQIPLESLDWVIDMKGQKLIGNPDHGGIHMLDAL